MKLSLTAKRTVLLFQKLCCMSAPIGNIWNWPGKTYNVYNWQKFLSLSNNNLVVFCTPRMYKQISRIRPHHCNRLTTPPVGPTDCGHGAAVEARKSLKTAAGNISKHLSLLLMTCSREGKGIFFACSDAQERSQDGLISSWRSRKNWSLEAESVFFSGLIHCLASSFLDDF